MTDPETQRPYRKEWLIATTRSEVGRRLARHRCDRGHLHEPLIGGKPAATAYYPRKMALEVIDGLVDE
eukprot:7888899-Lingulodinium_polyedra.AAC.1